MPIVFVHGVNTRKGPAYDAGTLVIDAFARMYLSKATIGGRALAQPVATFPYGRLSLHGGSLLAGSRPGLVTTRVPRAVRSRRSQISTAIGTSPSQIA